MEEYQNSAGGGRKTKTEEIKWSIRQRESVSPEGHIWTSVYFKWGFTAFLVIAAGISFYYLMFRSSNLLKNFRALTNILMPVMFGLVMAYLLTPVLNFIEFRILLPLCSKAGLQVKSPKRRSMVRGVGILCTTLLFFLLIYSLCSMMLSQIVPSIVTIVNNFDTYIANITRWINQLLDDNPETGKYIISMINKYSNELEHWLNDSVLPNISSVVRTVSLSVLGGVKVLWNFIIGFIISIYVMASKERFAGQAKKLVYALFRRPTANQIVNNFRFTHRTFIGFIGGKIVDSIIIGVLCFIGTSIMGTPYAALVSVIVGVTNVIPFFGPYLGAIPSTILIFVVDLAHPLNCVYFLIFILILQQFDGNILGPKILGSSTGLNGFWVIFAITLFGGLFGILGMIVGVPIFAVFYAAVKALINTSLQKKALPSETEPYLAVGSVDAQGEFHEFVPEYKSKKDSGVRLRKRKPQEKEKDGDSSGMK
ncbi:MAG: AI-2E family transporter [Candidatus Gastranaerophilales bacterium]|nr:AI-2E family transporter [Candidatus Gastranaerophilales bacterium]